MSTIKIKLGKQGFNLIVNGKYIYFNEKQGLKVVSGSFWASDFCSIGALRAFWSKYMFLIIAITTKHPTKADQQLYNAINRSDCVIDYYYY